MPTTTARNKGFLSHMLYLGEIGKLRMKYNNEEYPPPQNEEDIDNKSDEGNRFELIDTTISDVSLDIAEMLVSKTKYEDKRMLENDNIQHFDYQKRQIEKDLLIRSFITTLLKKTNQFTHLKNDEISIDYAERLIKEAGSKKQSFGDLSILFVVHEKADILGIRARINEYFLRKLGCDTQEYYSDRYDFQKDARNITIIYPKICLMYLRNTRFSLSDIDFLIFYPSRSKLGENNQFEVIINEFYMPEVVAGSKKMPKLMIYEPQLEKGKGGREGIKFVFDLMNMNTRWELSIQAKFWSELFTHALHILEVQIDQFQKEKSQKAKNNSLIKKYGEQLKIFKPAMLAPFPDYNGVCYRQFWTAFVGIKDI